MRGEVGVGVRHFRLPTSRCAEGGFCLRELDLPLPRVHGVPPCFLWPAHPTQSEAGADGKNHEGKPVPRRPKQQPMAAPSKTLPFPVLFLQHFLLVAPCGLVLLWISYPVVR